ncbi:hypothetical protein ACLOJK_019048 [Asimina triloba]
MSVQLPAGVANVTDSMRTGLTAMDLGWIYRERGKMMGSTMMGLLPIRGAAVKDAAVAGGEMLFGHGEEEVAAYLETVIAAVLLGRYGFEDKGMLL